MLKIRKHVAPIRVVLFSIVLFFINHFLVYYLLQGWRNDESLSYISFVMKNPTRIYYIATLFISFNCANLLFLKNRSSFWYLLLKSLCVWILLFTILFLLYILLGYGEESDWSLFRIFKMSVLPLILYFPGMFVFLSYITAVPLTEK